MLKNYRPQNFQKSAHRDLKLPIFQFHSLQKFSDEVEHAVLSRLGGVSKKPFDSLNVSFNVNDNASDVQQNRQLVLKAFGLANKSLVSAIQTHSKNVCVVDKNFMENYEAGYEVNDVDAFITQEPGVALMVKVADCQAILMFDPVQKVIAALHAGWRGLMQDISGETIAVLQKNFGVKSENLIVGISPSLGPCCSFFSDPYQELSKDFKPYIKQNNTVDLWKFSTDQLVRYGVKADHIELARVCSMCGGGEKFYSFRRDRGVTGRFGVLIFLR